jgi:hypothetical protein
VAEIFAESVGDLVFGDVLCCAIAIPTGIEAEDGLRDIRGFLGNCLVVLFVVLLLLFCCDNF